MVVVFYHAFKFTIFSELNLEDVMILAEYWNAISGVKSLATQDRVVR